MSHGSLIWLFEISFRWTKIVGSKIFFDGDIKKSLTFTSDDSFSFTLSLLLWKLKVVSYFNRKCNCFNTRLFCRIHTLTQPVQPYTPSHSEVFIKVSKKSLFFRAPVSWLSHTLNVREVSRHTYYLAIVAAGQTSEAMRRRHNGCWSRRRSLTTTSLRLVHFAECSLSAGYRNSWQVINVNSLNLNTIIKLFIGLRGKSVVKLTRRHGPSST